MKKCPTSKAAIVGFIVMAIAGFAGARQDDLPPGFLSILSATF